MRGNYIAVLRPVVSDRRLTSSTCEFELGYDFRNFFRIVFTGFICTYDHTRQCFLIIVGGGTPIQKSATTIIGCLKHLKIAGRICSLISITAKWHWGPPRFTD